MTIDYSRSKKLRAEYLAKHLEKLFPKMPIPLDHTDPYTLLIAVLLSAQCTDERVNQVTPQLFTKAITPQQMVKLSVEQIQQIIRPCGLSLQKAKAIHQLSKILIEKHNSQVPANLEQLESLPGVGHKTASVVMAQAFGEPSFPVDTHIHRLAQAWGLSSGKNVTQTEKDLKKLFARNLWNKLHLQIIFYGRQYCTARQCDGQSCQVCQLFFPNRKKPKQIKRA